MTTLRDVRTISLAALLAACAPAASPGPGAGESRTGPAPATPAQPVPVREEDVRYPSGNLTLAALLLVPEGTGRRPAAVVVQGSGASDRRNQWARSIADELAASGLVVLLTDKRGSGASEGDWRSAGFDELATDALAGARYLRARPEVDPARVGLVGLSQGGWVAPVAAAGGPEVAFVVVVSGAASTFADQSHLEMANTARQAGLSAEAVEEVLALNRAAGHYLDTGDWQTYASLREKGLASAWRPVAEGYPATPDAPVWAFLRKVYRFDPIPYWRRTRQPVLVVYGEEDERDNVPVRESVRRLREAFAAEGKANHAVHVVPGVGHSLMDHRTHALAPEFVRTLRAWIAETTRAEE